jgi:hypothetical protein
MDRRIQHTQRIAALLLLGALFFSCEQPGGLAHPEDGEATPAIDYTAGADGVNGSEDSTAVRFAFEKAVSGLTGEDISLANATGIVTKGGLSGEGAAWSLAIAVAQAGDIKVRITKDGIAAAEKTVTVYKQGEQAALSWTAAANGTADRETSTAIAITLSGAVPALSAGDIRLEPGTGAASIGELSGSGQSWVLSVAVERAGTVSLGIQKEGIDSASRTVIVHKDAAVPPAVDYSVDADGANSEEDSTAVSFVFDQAVSGLSADDISLANVTGVVTKGGLSGEGAAWSLAIAVAKAGDIKVRITKEGITAAEKTVTVYRRGEQAILSWTVRANGETDTETTTALAFSFSGAVPALSAGDIRLEPGTGRASAADFSGSGQTWIMLVAVEQAGTISVGIDREGIEGGPKNVTVHKGAEAPPPEKVGIVILSPPDTAYYGKNAVFNSAGLEVAWLYSDGSTELVPAGGYTLDEPNMGRYTTQTIRVRAGGFETNFTIDVVNTDRILLSITASGPANKAQILGREFDRTGLAVTGHFSDGAEKDLASLAAIVGYDKFRRGPQAVNVRVNGKTASLDGIVTRVGDTAVVTVFTGIGVNNTYIKGETMTPEKANIILKVAPPGQHLVSDIRYLTLENGGLLPEDFNALIAAYNPDRTGRQTLPMTVDGRRFDINFYVADAEPAVWFDYGYMRHDGDPEGSGPGAGKHYARPGETLVIAPVRYLIGYNSDHSDAGVTYQWTVSGGVPYTTSGGGEFLHITPQTEGTCDITVSVTGRNFVQGGSVTKSARTELVCHTGTVSAEGKTFASPLQNFGPGQMCEGGTGLGWSLGSAGGYEVWTVGPSGSYNIYGNAFGSWNEAGVVWMQEDNNGNGLPDEMWHEITGGEDEDPARKKQITRRYAITCFKTDDHGTTNGYGQIIKEVHWVDSRGRTGMIPGGFPDKYWGVQGGRVTCTCTLLRDDGNFFAGGYNLEGLRGYVDTVGDSRFSSSKAVRADGTPANLKTVKFLKVQTGIFRYGDIFGDVSTEIQEADFLGVQSSFPKPYQ